MSDRTDLLDRIERGLDPDALTFAQRGRVQAFRWADIVLPDAPLEDRLRLAEWILSEAAP